MGLTAAYAPSNVAFKEPGTESDPAANGQKSWVDRVSERDHFVSDTPVSWIIWATF